MARASRLKAFLAELRRRRIYHVAAAYGVVAFIVLQVGALVFPALLLPSWTYTLVVVLTILGFPIALVLAWAHEVTYETPRWAEHADLGVAAEPVRWSGRKISRFAAAGTVLFAGAVVGLNVGGLRDSLSRGFGGTGRAGPPVPVTLSVAVLPFANLSPDPENEYFSDGMTEELISKLSRIQNLQVAARTSVTRFKGTDKDVRQIGEELGVRYVLEGSVRKAADRVRITAQLIDASNGFHVWSEDFDGELEDVFAVQENTALKIAEALDLRLSPKEAEAVRRRYTENAQAYDAYLRGWALLESWNLGIDRPEKLEAARKQFERALALDSEYALALTGLSLVESYTYWIGAGTREHLERAEGLALRALALDPQLSEAHAALGDAYGLGKDWARAIDEYRQAIRLDPRNYYAWEELAWALNFKEPPEPEEAERAAREAVRLQPGWVWSYYQLGTALRLQKRYEEAIDAFEQALQINPAFRSGILGLGRVYLEQGNYNRALARFNEARRAWESAGLLFLISAAHAALGEKEKGLAELEKALAGGYRDFAAIDTSRHFASLRADRRFQALLRRYRE